jgi:hypothetical protein
MKTVPHVILCDMWQYVRMYLLHALACFKYCFCVKLLSYFGKGKVKVKLTLEQATKSQRVIREIALLSP